MIDAVTEARIAVQVAKLRVLACETALLEFHRSRAGAGEIIDNGAQSVRDRLVEQLRRAGRRG